VDKTLAPVVITAIADSDFEGFVASTLFSQGWSVSFRALDINALVEYVKSNDCSDTILIFSPDLPGLTQDILNSLKPLLHRLIGFTSASGLAENFFDIAGRPKGPLDLLEAIRGNIRAPMVRAPQVPKMKSKRAEIIAFASLGHASGCTTLAINYAFEISHLNKKVLLIDANHAAPAIAILLDQRNLNSMESWKAISENIYAAEVTHENLDVISENLFLAVQEFDFIIVDLGSVRDLSNILIYRRWNSQIAMWCCNSADYLNIVTNPGLLPEQRLRKFVHSLGKISISAKIGYIFNGKVRNRKGQTEEELFMATVTPHRPDFLYILPSDLRGVTEAQNEQKPLAEVNERGTLRKAIAEIVSERVS